MHKTFLLGLALISTPATAADWRLIAEDSGGNVTFLDASSITANEQYRETWQKISFKEPDHGASYSVGHWRYDCSGQTAELLSYVDYGDDDSLRRSYTFPQYQLNWQDVPPDTLGETILKFVCHLPVRKAS
jgi:hypothetical protein